MDEAVHTSAGPAFFAAPAEFREWLEQPHDSGRELWVGFYKRASGGPSITWPEAVDEALCFGWIDGLRKGLDDVSYMIRFTPRKPRSTWSAVNVQRAEELIVLGRMRPAGLRAFGARTEDGSRRYSYEQAQDAELPNDYAARFQEEASVWSYFQAQPGWYRKAAIWWVASAKREKTRDERLAKLIENSRQGRTVPPLTRRPRRA
ncbi:MAG: YdeI/OmpD-associated family protein [Chloroflexota bacterium]|nr:YdeI/OmpD-associated family protein [Chloroflexota bacterium]